MEFPCRFAIKVIGNATDGFEQQVAAIVARHVDEDSIHEIAKRASSAGKYQSVTVTIEAHSRAQLDEVYAELTATPEILMAL